MHITELVAGLIRDGKLTLTVPIERVATYHDPCRLNKRKGIHKSPREILRAIPGLDFRDVDHVTQWSYCSGAGGGLSIERPEITAAISQQRLDHAAALDVDLLVSACVWSERPLAAAGEARDIEVRDLMELVAESAGLEVDGGDDMTTMAISEALYDELVGILGEDGVLTGKPARWNRTRRPRRSRCTAGRTTSPT